MKKARHGLVRNYHNACLQIAKKFWNKYFSETHEDNFETAISTDDFYPIGGEVDGIWDIMNYQYWSLSDMATALEYKATKEQLDEWYDSTTEMDEKLRKNQSLKNFLIYGWIENSKEYQKKYEKEVKECNEKVKEAKKIFEKCIYRS